MTANGSKEKMAVVNPSARSLGEALGVDNMDAVKLIAWEAWAMPGNHAEALAFIWNSSPNPASAVVAAYFYGHYAGARKIVEACSSRLKRTAGSIMQEFLEKGEVSP